MKWFGLKLWSKDFIKNIDFVKEAEKALKEGKFDYLELFALPSLFDEIKEEVNARFLGVKTIIHAPHAIQGLDLAVREEFSNNKKRLEPALKFADLLNAEMIILHPGCGVGEVFFEESVRQFKEMNDARLTVENLPAYCSQTKRLLHGVSPLDIKRFMEETKAKFCLDFSHAICGANSSKRDIYEVLSEFKALKPAMYHLCDGDVLSTNDSHLHYGEGNYDLRRLVLDFTTEDALLTMETGHGIPQDVKPWLDDVSYIRRIIA